MSKEEKIIPVIGVVVTALIVAYDNRSVSVFVMIVGFLGLFLYFARIRQRAWAIISVKEDGLPVRLKNLIQQPSFVAYTLLLIVTAASGHTAWNVEKRFSPDPLYDVMVMKPFSNNLLIAVHSMEGNSEALVDAAREPELSLDVRRRLPSGGSVLQRSTKPNERGYAFVSGLPDGEYEVDLKFYGIVLDRISKLKIDHRSGAYAELHTPRYQGCITFKVVDANNHPVQGVSLTVAPGEGFYQIRESVTDEEGETECLWLYSTGKSDSFYLVDVKKGRKSDDAILRDIKVSVVFESQWERKTQTFRVKTSAVPGK